jgi:hypothetical protein
MYISQSNACICLISRAMLDEITSDVMKKMKKNDVKKDREGMHQRQYLNWIQSTV